MEHPLRLAARARILIACTIVGLVTAPPPPRAESTSQIRLQSFEQAIADSPEDLRLAADYRQLAIEAGEFNRATEFFEHLVKRGEPGPNLLISLALAYADKVPQSNEFRRAYLGRDAMAALTRSITMRPSVLAYYIRGRINLYYDRFIFRRVDKGIADLTEALGRIAGDTPPSLAALVYRTLGDGYLKDDNPNKAREIWSAGATRFPEDAGLRDRLDLDGPDLWRIVGPGLSPSHRPDTSLHGMLPVSQ
jgi:hypothetical protein